MGSRQHSTFLNAETVALTRAVAQRDGQELAGVGVELKAFAR